jgi:hypothetical protein
VLLLATIRYLFQIVFTKLKLLQVYQIEPVKPKINNLSQNLWFSESWIEKAWLQFCKKKVYLVYCKLNCWIIEVRENDWTQGSRKVLKSGGASRNKSYLLNYSVNKVHSFLNHCLHDLHFMKTIVKSFYDVKYGLSIIMSNVHQINLSNENIKNKHWCFQISKIASQKNHFDLHFVLKTFFFRLLRRNNKLKINNFLMNMQNRLRATQ